MHIQSIDPWRYGFSGILPGIGPLGDSQRWAECAEPHVQVIEHFPGPSGHTRDGTGRYSDKLTWDLMPFCGTLACAPEREVFTSLLGQGPFGGNIDCRDVRAGHTILLNAYHEGGLLYVGDMHGGQGTPSSPASPTRPGRRSSLSATVIKGKHAPCVRIEKPDSIVAVGINLPMEHAVYDACDNMMQWLRDDYGISRQGHVHPHVVRPGLPHPHLPDGARGHDPACRRRGIPQGAPDSGVLIPHRPAPRSPAEAAGTGRRGAAENAAANVSRQAGRAAV